VAEHRSIRSYVLRQGRLSKAQQRAHQELLPHFGIPYAPKAIDLDAAFGRRAPKVVEIGSGMGETTARIAEEHPQNDYLAIEVHTPGVGSLLKLIADRGLRNVRVVQHDAVEVLEHMIGRDSLAGVHIFFPDPWPKKRHHKRRLIQPDFASLVASRLAPGGRLHLATDWEEYAHHMLEVLSAEPLLRNTAHGFCETVEGRPTTKFETRGLKLGHEVFELLFERVATPAGKAPGDR
jgi:tRNA (guanine-N7-)-methyltransferase